MCIVVYWNILDPIICIYWWSASNSTFGWSEGQSPARQLPMWWCGNMHFQIPAHSVCRRCPEENKPACAAARIHRARNGSSVTQRHQRQAAKYAGDGHHPYKRIRVGQVQHLRPDVSRAATPRPAFVWTVVPQGLNHAHVHSMSLPWSVRTSPPWSVRTQGACCSTGEIGAPCDEHNRRDPLQDAHRVLRSNK